MAVDDPRERIVAARSDEMLNEGKVVHRM
jgi:hypothetical protein